ncbi:MAG: redoxin domain-containing protein [Nitriliruptoraceae bacterium]
MTLPVVGEPFPDLKFPVVGADDRQLSEITLGRWSLILFYRDDDCSLCQAYFDRVSQQRDELEHMDFQIVALSADSKERATSVRDKHDLWFPIGHSLPLSFGKELGIYVNADRKCFEPAFFILDTNGLLVHASIQSGPHARPLIEELAALIARKRSTTPAR